MIIAIKLSKKQIGDRVYLQIAHCQVCLARIFCKKWNGLYRIIVKVFNVDFKIKDIRKGTRITAHGNRLRVAHLCGLFPSIRMGNVRNKSLERRNPGMIWLPTGIHKKTVRPIFEWSFSANHVCKRCQRTKMKLFQCSQYLF